MQVGDLVKLRRGPDWYPMVWALYLIRPVFRLNVAGSLLRLVILFGPKVGYTSECNRASRIISKKFAKRLDSLPPPRYIMYVNKETKCK